jgi:hypothetical protein
MISPAQVAVPINGFPSLAEILFEIGAILNVLLGIALAANLAVVASGIG